MSTLAISQIFYYLFHDFDFSGGSDGVFINVIKPIEWFNLNINFLGGTYSLFYLSLAFCFLSAALAIFISKSKLGLVLNAIRLNEEKVSALGYSVKNLKLFVFVLSAILSAIAGVLFSLQFGYINPENLSWHLSVIGMSGEGWEPERLSGESCRESVMNYGVLLTTTTLSVKTKQQQQQLYCISTRVGSYHSEYG